MERNFCCLSLQGRSRSHWRWCNALWNFGTKLHDVSPHTTLIRREYVTQSSFHCIITLRLSNTCPTIICEITISSFYTKFTHVWTAMVYRARTNWSNPRSALSSCAKTVTKFTSCLINGIVYIQPPNLKHRTLTEHTESVLEISGQDFLNVTLYM